MNKHLQAILDGKVTKSNVIGIRKAINAFERRCNGLSTSSTSPRLSGKEIDAIERALADNEPLITGELHDSGLRLLRSSRYAKRLAAVADIVNSPDLCFHLVAFDRLGNRSQYSVPVYRARGGSASFMFRNIPWQSGGNGPEILQTCF